MFKHLVGTLACVSAFVLSANAIAIGTEVIPSQAATANATPSSAANQRISALAQVQSVRSTSVIKIDPSAFFSNVININFKSYHLTFLKGGGEVVDSNNWTWTGAAQDGTGEAVVACTQGTVVGSFRYQQTLLRLEQTSAGEYLLLDLDQEIHKPTRGDHL